jgi:hypothetical protein
MGKSKYCSASLGLPSLVLSSPKLPKIGVGRALQPWFGVPWCTVKESESLSDQWQLRPG